MGHHEAFSLPPPPSPPDEVLENCKGPLRNFTVHINLGVIYFKSVSLPLLFPESMELSNLIIENKG